MLSCISFREVSLLATRSSRRNTLCEPREMDSAVELQYERHSPPELLGTEATAGQMRAHPLQCPRHVDFDGWTRCPAKGTRLHAT